MLALLTRLRWWFAGQAWGLARRVRLLAAGWRAVLAALAGGALPCLAGWSLSTSLHQPATAACLFVLVLAAVSGAEHGRAMALLAVGFMAHAATAIALSALDPAGAAACLPDGAAYWEAQHRWITTGVDPEYQWVTWLPHHVQLVVAVVLLGVLSLGLMPLFRGVYEADLMNHYVGRLLASSEDPATAMLLGWHPWSVLRGLGFVVLLVELTSWSLERLTARSLSTPTARHARLVGAGALLVADAVAKLLLAEPVRATLAANMR